VGRENSTTPQLSAAHEIVQLRQYHTARRETPMQKVLVVDNEQRILDLFSKLMSKAGLKVLTAAGGTDCLRIAQSERPDLILLDVDMPGMDGGEVAQHLLENDQTQNIPVVFLTSMVTEEETVAKSGMIGEQKFISKFSDSGEIIEKVKKILNASAGKKGT
jgi:CheY-like chemotaxis protein